MLEIVLDEELASADDDDPYHFFCPRCDPEGEYAYCGTYIGDLLADPEVPSDEPFCPQDCSMCAHEWEVHICPA